MRNKGCRIKWDLAKAKEMWLANRPINEIIEAANTTESAVYGAAARYRWPRRAPVACLKRNHVWKRCGCGARYAQHVEDTTPHCQSRAFRSIYEAHAA